MEIDYITMIKNLNLRIIYQNRKNETIENFLKKELPFTFKTDGISHYIYFFEHELWCSTDNRYDSFKELIEKDFKLFIILRANDIISLHKNIIEL